MHIIEFKDSKPIIVTNATGFKINKKLNAVIFKYRLKTVGYHDLTNVLNVFEIGEIDLEEPKKIKGLIRR